MHVDARLKRLVEPVVRSLGLQLWGIEILSPGRRKILRIYIDGTEGVTLSDCEVVSRQLSSLFDVEDPMPGDYVLEVSSPGMDRPLFLPEQFARYVGDEIRVKLRQAYAGRRNFKGLLRAVADDELHLVVSQHEYVLPIELIDHANVVPQFQAGSLERREK